MTVMRTEVFQERAIILGDKIGLMCTLQLESPSMSASDHLRPIDGVCPGAGQVEARELTG